MQRVATIVPRIAVFLLVVSGSTAGLAESTERAKVAAPPLRECKASESRDLGTWDDAFAVADQDLLVLRRGEALFSLSMNGPAEPKRLKAAAILKPTQIVAAVAVEERLWVFANSRETVPFAFDATSGDIAKFEIPGLAVPGEQAPGIQSPILVPHARAAILAVSGGDRRTWPREGNRPIYFWMDLAAGKVRRFPNGWDLEYFAAAQSVAVFAASSEKRFERRPLEAIDMKTGLPGETPDRSKERYVPYDWSDANPVKTLYARQPGQGDAEFFAGLSYRGRAIPIDIDLEGRQYLAQAKAAAGHAGFRLRRSGGSPGEPSPYWVVPFAEPSKPERIHATVTDFVLLDDGHGVFVTAGHGHKERSSEAWYYPRGGKEMWNVLDGVERLPPLPKEFAAADYIEERTLIELHENMGTPARARLVLCVCTQQRGDRRALTFPFAGKHLESAKWRRALVFTGDGRRDLTPLFRDARSFDKLWLDSSGKVVVGTHTWQTIGDKQLRQIQLAEVKLELPQK